MNRTKLAALEAAIRDCDDEHEPTEADVLAFELDMRAAPTERLTAAEVEEMLENAARYVAEFGGEPVW